jgi:hypothetical protein
MSSLDFCHQANSVFKKSKTTHRSVAGKTQSLVSFQSRMSIRRDPTYCRNLFGFFLSLFLYCFATSQCCTTLTSFTEAQCERTMTKALIVLMIFLSSRLATAFFKRRHMMGSLLTLSAATKAFEQGYVTVSRNDERFSLYYRMYSKNESSSTPLVVLHGGPYVFN